MKKEELKQKILEANKAYRYGNAIMSDTEFDTLVEEFQVKYPDEYNEFRDSLNEGTSTYGEKVEHPYIMGSLNKISLEDADDVKKFINKYAKTSLNVSAKVDGISCRLHYSHGTLVQASTRGNGKQGIDITDKIKYVKGVKPTISWNNTLDIRGELVILNADFADLDGFANPRNACAGIVNRKDWSKSDVSHISFVPYTILGDEFSKSKQFEILESLGFDTAWHQDFSIEESTSDNFISVLTTLITTPHEYETDGLVVSDSSYVNETEYRPAAAVALKSNMNFAISKIVDVEWRGPSKNGKFVPVAQIEPVKLCGTTVSQATLNNLDFIAKMGLKYGSVVKVQKRGEIVPAIVELMSNENTMDIVYPTECPCCGSTLVVDGPFVWCKNLNCSDQTLHQLTMFIKKLGVKHSSEATLKNFKISSIDDLLKFRPNPKYKSEITLDNELMKNVYSKTREQLFCAMDFEGLSETLLQKILDFYTLDKIVNFAEMSTSTSIADFFKFVGSTALPTGIGEIMLKRFIDGLHTPVSMLKKITSDSRWSPMVSPSDNMSTEIVGSICVTGNLKFGSRGKFLEFAKQHGYESRSGVSKGLTYLINNDIDSSSSKNKKAKQLGITILSEDQFMKLIKEVNDVQDDLSSL